MGGLKVFSIPCSASHVPELLGARGSRPDVLPLKAGIDGSHKLISTLQTSWLGILASPVKSPCCYPSCSPFPHYELREDLRIQPAFFVCRGISVKGENAEFSWKVVCLSGNCWLRAIVDSEGKFTGCVLL